MRRIFIGDIQGCLEPLDRLLTAVEFEPVGRRTVGARFDADHCDVKAGRVDNAHRLINDEVPAPCADFKVCLSNIEAGEKH